MKSKKLAARLVFLLFLMKGSLAIAQQDTLLYETFNTIPSFRVGKPNAGADSVWFNYDRDSLADGNNRARNWFFTVPFAQKNAFLPNGRPNYVYASSSWLNGFSDGTRNYLITPRIKIWDTTATLSWQSAPLQAPAYMDGYTVLVSTTDNQPESFTDTLAHFAQTIPPIGTGYNPSNYRFSRGYIHGNGLTDSSFAILDTANSRYICLLQKHTANLKTYAGKNIYICFLHNSDNDNLLSIDEVLLKGFKPRVGIMEDKHEQMGFKIDVFPNPTSDKTLVSYYLAASCAIKIEVYGQDGKCVETLPKGVQFAGFHESQIDVSRWSRGIYHVVVNVNDVFRMSRKLVVK